MLTFAISVLIMLAVVGGCVQWAVREERRRKLQGGADAGTHR
jgi:hypothetical protein